MWQCFVYLQSALKPLEFHWLVWDGLVFQLLTVKVPFTVVAISVEDGLLQLILQQPSQYWNSFWWLSNGRLAIKGERLHSIANFSTQPLASSVVTTNSLFYGKSKQTVNASQNKNDVENKKSGGYGSLG